MDRYEGFPDYYTKQTWPVRMGGGYRIKGLIDIMNIIRAAPPARSYYNHIANAYAEVGLISEIKTVLVPALRRSLGRTCR